MLSAAKCSKLPQTWLNIGKFLHLQRGFFLQYKKGVHSFHLGGGLYFQFNMPCAGCLC